MPEVGAGSAGGRGFMERGLEGRFRSWGGFCGMSSGSLQKEE